MDRSEGRLRNFGIVTCFDMYTFPAKNLWGGIRAAARSEGMSSPR